MKRALATLAIAAIAPAYCIAQPADPASIGLTPRTATVYVNTNYNNNGLNSIGIDINSDLNVVVGWEDDRTPSWHIYHWAAIWTLYDRDGNLLTPEVTITNGNPLQAGQPVTSIPDTTYRAYFRNDGSPIPGRTSWGPKIKANQFGPGFGMGAVSYAAHVHFSSSGTNGIGNEIAHLYDINVDSTTHPNSTNDLGVLLTNIGAAFPPVQLMNNDQTPAAPFSPGERMPITNRLAMSGLPTGIIWPPAIS